MLPIPIGHALGRGLCLGAVAVTISLVIVVALAQRQKDIVSAPPPLLTSEPTDGFRPVRLLDPLPPITEFETPTVSQVKDELGPSELVLGVTVNGQSRAYPINMLTGPRREIINDTVGNRAIAATW